MTLIGVCRTFVPMVLVAAACSDPGGPGTGTTIDELPRPLTAAEQKLVTGSNAFAFDLMREINKAQPRENVFVSPLSASMALGMTANGASGTTWDAMRTGLRLGNVSREEIGAGYKSLIALLRGLDKTTDFRIANSIWYRKSFPFHQSYLDESRSFFDASVEGLDFASPDAVKTINTWVDNATARKIPSIIDEIKDDHVMFLINAIYFKGAWQDRFDKSRTENAPFRALDGSSASVPLMHRSGKMRIAWDPAYTAVDLLYGNSAFAMTVVLPAEGTDVNSVVESLTEAKWKSLEGSISERQALLYLPRFRLDWKRELNEDLKALGMQIAFTDGEADFTRMSPVGDRLFITEVIQKTFVDVNEEGTEAAAATSVGVGVTSAPAAVRVDRPFIFVIRERFSGTILFMGKIAKLPA